MSPAPVSPLLELDGAVQADGLDAGVAAHYGNPMIEQRRLLAGEAVVDLSNRGVLGVAGPDRLTWLNSISSQELRRLAPGESTETLLLDPNGRIEYAMAVVDDGVETWLILEADDESVVAAALLHLGLLGNVHTSTARAFNAAEMDAILKKVND